MTERQLTSVALVGIGVALFGVAVTFYLMVFVLEISVWTYLLMLAVSVAASWGLMSLGDYMARRRNSR